MGETLGPLMYTPTMFTMGLLGTCLVAGFLWWIVRRKEDRIWLPTIRILPLESRILPKIMIRVPPLVAFLCFLGILGALLFLSTKPKSQIFRTFDPNQSKHLIFVDFSPSVSRHISLEDLKILVKATCDQLIGNGKVQGATSHKKEVYSFDHCEDFDRMLQTLDFHRAGLKLGEAIKKTMALGVDVDHIYIVSDRDQHTWIDFNWNFLRDEAEVYLVDTSKPQSGGGNLYINNAQMLTQLQASPGSTSSEWDIEISRTFDEGEYQGTLQVVYENQTIKEHRFAMSPGRKRQTYRVDWQTTPPPKGSLQGTNPFVVFQIADQQPKIENQILLDDRFYAYYSSKKQNIMVIAENSGEQSLEDPLGPLMASLDTLGFTMERKDFIDQGKTLDTTRDLLIIAGGDSTQAERFCPTTHQVKDPSGSPTNDETPLGNVWLAPLNTQIDYFEMCRCLGRLLPKNGAFKVAACEHVHTRKDWVTLLPSIGGKQIGGTLGTQGDALAYFFKSIVAFTMPLAPQKSLGLSFAKLPILVRDLLTWQGLYQRQTLSRKSEWPRFADIATDLWDQTDIEKPTQISNVPIGESDLNTMDSTDLPPIWNPLQNNLAKTVPMKRDMDDPVPWIKLVFMLLIALTGLELLAWLGVKVHKITKMRLAPLWIGAFLGWVHGDLSYAKVEFGVYGNKDANLSIKFLAKEVSARTSIELTSAPFRVLQLDGSSLTLPWIWISDINGLITPDTSIKAGGEGSLKGSPIGSFTNDLMMWLRRGGFLVLETNLSTNQLQQLTKNLGTAEVTPWLPLPPDHELMRSFYLIDALPDCQGEIWRGLQFDGRLAILAIPYGFLDSLKDKRLKPNCGRPMDQEYSTRVFVNLIMVALATDYKKDQIHLPEILKRLR